MMFWIGFGMATIIYGCIAVFGPETTLEDRLRGGLIDVIIGLMIILTALLAHG